MHCFLSINFIMLKEGETAMREGETAMREAIIESGPRKYKCYMLSRLQVMDCHKPLK